MAKVLHFSLNRSTRASRFPLVDFVFAYADLLEKDMERLEYEDDIFKRLYFIVHFLICAVNYFALVSLS